MNPALPDFDLAFTDAELDRVFVISDPHFGHANIIKYCNRPFPDAATMDAALVANWNVTVPPDATVWVLGDMTVNPDKLGGLLARLHGRKVLVAGNHDQPHPVSLSNKGRRREQLADYARAFRDAGFDAVQLSGAFTLPDFGRVRVCHYPYSDGADWLRVRLPDDGETPLLHGHVHDKWRFKGRMLNAGVEVQDYRPITLREIRDLFRAERAAGWPTVGNPEAEKFPDAAVNPELPPEERLHVRRWFLVTGNGPLPELPGVGSRPVPAADGTALFEVWIDGSNPDMEFLWRRCYLSPALTLVGGQLLSPYPANRSPRLSADEQVGRLDRPHPREYWVLIEVPLFEAQAVAKYLHAGDPEPFEDEDRAASFARFTLPDGVKGTLKRTHRVDADRLKVPGTATADLLLEYPAGRSVSDSCRDAILFHRRLPLRERKPLTLLEPA